MLDGANVRVWLRDAKADSELAFRLIENILQCNGLDGLFDEKCIDDGAALSSLLRRECFSGRWAGQGIAFATSFTVFHSDFLELTGSAVRYTDID